MKNFFTISLFFISFSFLAQDTLQGIVLRKSDGQPLPYVQVGIASRQAGTLSDEKGKFLLIIRPHVSSQDTLVFRMMGYKPVKMVTGNKKFFSVTMEEEPYQLEEIPVKPTKTYSITLGNKKYNKGINCYYMVSSDNTRSGEGGIRAKNKKNREVWLEWFHFYIIKNPKKDTVLFRLNIYAADASGDPGELLNNQSIIFKVPPLKTGVIDVDLRQYGFHVKGDFFLVLEVLSEMKKEEQIAFSGSIIGPAYFRANSFSKWMKVGVMGLDFNVDAVYFK